MEVEEVDVEDVREGGGVDVEDVREGRVGVVGDSLGKRVGAGIGFMDEGGISGIGGVWGGDRGYEGLRGRGEELEE